MDGSSPENTHNPEKGTALLQVTTHFGSLETERAPMVINLSNLPSIDEYQKVVDQFYSELKSEHPYQYQDIIGEGGMGIVEMVKDKKCLRSIAKKTLNKDKIDQESIVRFTEEAQITAQLEHPNIVPVYEMGLDENDQLFYTMKMIKGRNLKDILKGIKEGDQEIIEKFPLANLLEIYVAVCDAMSYACSKKIVHRDLKPENIMVGDYGEVYIVDWGLAKIIKNDALKSTEEIPEWIVKEVYEKQDLSTDKFLRELRKVDSMRTKNQNLDISFNNILIGTPQYMAPERISGEADECSEVYALGAILYNILTLELTVEGKNLEEIIIKVFDGEIKNPLLFKNLPHLPDNKVPSGLAAVTMKALKVEPIERYHTVKELRNEISAWEDGFITEAEKAGPWLVIWSMIKRHKIEAGLALSFFGLLISIYTIYAVKLNQDLNLARESEKIALDQKEIVEKETAKLLVKSQEVEDTIIELVDLAPNLYERSIFLVKNNLLKGALRTIKDACRLSPEKIYFIQRGNIEQSLKLFKESITSYEEALKLQKDSKLIKDAIIFSKQFINKPLESYTDLLKFREFLLSQKRFTEAALISKELRLLTVNMRYEILDKFDDTHFNFVRSKMLQVDSSGGFSLDLSNRGIKDISPLEGIPFKSLNLEGNPITDLTPLNGMPLETLNINDTKVSNISHLKGAPLKYFSARNTEITKLNALNGSPLVELNLEGTEVISLIGLTSPFLKDIDLSHSKVMSLRHLNWRSVHSLNINSTNIKDLTPLKNMPLTKLTLRRTKVTDLKALEKGFIKTLDISFCNIENFSPIKTLPLQRFIASSTKIKDIDFLKGKRLIEVNLDNTAVKNINYLKGMPISNLSLYESAVININAASNMPLSYLNLSRTKIEKLPTFQNMADLAQIHLYDSSIKSLSSLSGKNINILNIGRTKIKSISELQNCTIKRLTLSGTNISDLSPLKGKSLQYLNISLCPVSDLSPLSESLIRQLDISRIPATDFSALKKMNLKHITAHAIKTKSPDFINKQTIEFADFGGSQITDLRPFAGSNIQVLNLAHNNIADISPLKSCTSLVELDLYNTLISSVKDIAGLRLKSLILGECNNLKSLAPLRKMKTLEKVIIPKNIKIIEFFREFPSLKYIGHTSSDHNQPTATFWEKFDESVPNE